MDDAAIRLGIFFGVFMVMALWEQGSPMRRLSMPWQTRWITNWSISIIDAVMVRLIFGAAALGAAFDAQTGGIGLFHSLGWHHWIIVAVSFVLLDFAIWLQHVLSHKIPILWRLHRVHHADRDIDVTTAIRFHPLEIAFSMIVKIGLVYALGVPPVAVIIFEVVLNGAAMFNHSNVRMPLQLEQALRWLVVTPDMHRVHHSVIREEHDTNFGFNLSVWDRIFGTYTAQPREGHHGMTIGLSDHQTTDPTKLLWSLGFPFQK